MTAPGVHEVYWYYSITGRPGIPWIPGPPLTGFITHLQKGRLAALAGGCFIGTGCGLVVRQGASCAGDDALALVISKATGCRISRAYLLTDVSVLVLSLSYIPAVRIVYSLITVIVSSFMIDFIQNFGVHKEDENSGKETLADNG